MMTFHQWLEERDPLIGQQFGVSNTKRGGDNTSTGHLIAGLSHPKFVKPAKPVFDGLKVVGPIYGKRKPSGVLGQK
jgi:hypothetical protein